MGCMDCGNSEHMTLPYAELHMNQAVVSIVCSGWQKISRSLAKVFYITIHLRAFKLDNARD